MNINLSNDQQTITVDGVEYYAKDYKGTCCGECDLNGECFCTPNFPFTCKGHERKDMREIVWKKKGGKQ